MKRLKLILSISMILFAQVAFTQTLNHEVINKEGKKKLLGKCDRSGLLLESYRTWFDYNYEHYTVNEELLQRNKKKHLKGVTIEIFMGTWCGDSKREVPRFYKVADALGFTESKLSLINVDNKDATYKQSPTHEERGKNIHRVPTFIVYKNGEEIGRIVETPVTSFEMDLTQIFNALPAYPNYKGVSKLDNFFSENGVTTDRKELYNFALTFYKDVKYDGELNTYGYVLLRRGEKEKALATFILNTILYSKSAKVYDSLAECYEAMEQPEEALNMYKKVLELDAKSEHAKLKIKELSASLTKE